MSLPAATEIPPSEKCLDSTLQLKSDQCSEVINRMCDLLYLASTLHI